MKIMLMTDLEGVAGVTNAVDWVEPDSRYYDKACRLLTEEVNAAVDGLFAGGAASVLVADGHGWGGIDVELLDPRVEYARGWGRRPWPFGLDATFDGIGWVGQHAKAGTERAHLCHTGSFKCIEFTVNGVSVGEFGQLALCASELGVPAFFASGDEAFAAEAEELVPGIVTCAVKRGVATGTGEECTTEEYGIRNGSAVHVPPLRARQLIREAAERAMKALRADPPALIPLKPPFERVVVYRPDKRGASKMFSRASHADSLCELMGMPHDLRPLRD